MSAPRTVFTLAYALILISCINLLIGAFGREDRAPSLVIAGVFFLLYTIRKWRMIWEFLRADAPAKTSRNLKVLLVLALIAMLASGFLTFRSDEVTLAIQILVTLMVALVGLAVVLLGTAT